MATWLTHLRVAERVSDPLNISDKSLFFAGSIAPDTDILPDFSHWCVDGDKTTCDAQGFFIKYISDGSEIHDKDFYWGYYIHLLTDILWHEQKIVPLKLENKEIIRTTKQKWRIADNSFLAAHGDFKPLMEMKYAMEYTAKYDKQWLDYYTKGQVSNLVDCILSTFNTAGVENKSSDFVVETEIERFIEDSVEYIDLKLREDAK